MVWLAVAEDSVTLLELATMTVLVRYPYSFVVTFGGCQEDFMLVVCPEESEGSQKLLFSLSKPKVRYQNTLSKLIWITIFVCVFRYWK